MMRKAIGIDLSRSKAIGILTDIEGNIVDRNTVDLPIDAPFSLAVEEIKKLITKLHHTDLTGICLGTPGWLDSARGICHFSPNYPTWKEIDMITPFKQFNVPVFIINDVNSAALGEKYYGAARTRHLDTHGPIFVEELGPPSIGDISAFAGGTTGRNTSLDEITSMVFISVGIGVGGGIIIHNELVVGRHEGAGEIGHITLDPEGPPCGCGNNGCLEAMCSLNAIKHGIAQGIKLGWPTLLTRHVKSPDEITYPIITQCARQGDELILKVLGTVGRYLGMGIANIMTVLDPEVIVIGGEAVEVLDILYPHMVRELKQRLRMFPYQNVKLVPVKLGELSIAYGASAYVFKRLFNI